MGHICFPTALAGASFEPGQGKAPGALVLPSAQQNTGCWSTHQTHVLLPGQLLISGAWVGKVPAPVLPVWPLWHCPTDCWKVLSDEWTHHARFWQPQTAFCFWIKHFCSLLKIFQWCLHFNRHCCRMEHIFIAYIYQLEQEPSAWVQLCREFTLLSNQYIRLFRRKYRRILTCQKTMLCPHLIANIHHRKEILFKNRIFSNVSME